MASIKAEFPDKLRFLFRPCRYKVARGGRGSAKSWSFARALLILGMQNRLRILCAREVQLSIKQSVHKLLKDQIALLGLESNYTVYESEIRGKNGTEIAFTGLSTLTVDTIKSFEGIDICWVEEGQAITKRSWEILIPTIRADESEIWISYNPDLETDDTHQRFTINSPVDCINVLINWRDNPWFNEVLEKERLHCQQYNPDDYDNIWEGKCRPAVEGAIYYKQIAEAEAQNRICNVPYDPMLKVHGIFDVGYGDALGCALVQKLQSSIRVIEYLESNRTDWGVYNAELRTRNYNWGKVWLPHDAFAKRIESGGRSSCDIMESLGWDVVPLAEIAQLGIEDGIRNARLKFPQFYFDKTHTAATNPIKASVPDFNATDLNGRMVEALKRYRRAINPRTEVVGGPIHNVYAHAADVLRYIGCNADDMSNESRLQIRIPGANRPIMPHADSGSAWLGV